MSPTKAKTQAKMQAKPAGPVSQTTGIDWAEESQAVADKVHAALVKIEETEGAIACKQARDFFDANRYRSDYLLGLVLASK